MPAECFVTSLNLPTMSQVKPKRQKINRGNSQHLKSQWLNDDDEERKWIIEHNRNCQSSVLHSFCHNVPLIVGLKLWVVTGCSPRGRSHRFLCPQCLRCDEIFFVLHFNHLIMCNRDRLKVCLKVFEVNVGVKAWEKLYSKVLTVIWICVP